MKSYREEFETVYPRMDGIPDLYSIGKEELSVIFDMVYGLPRGAQVTIDIGGGRGRSAIIEALAGAWTVVSVSPWTLDSGGAGNITEFKAHLDMAGVTKAVNILDMTSQEASRMISNLGGLADFIFLDANHGDGNPLQDKIGRAHV